MPKTNITITCPPWLHDALKAAAQRQGVSVSALVRTTLQRALDVKPPRPAAIRTGAHMYPALNTATVSGEWGQHHDIINVAIKRGLLPGGFNAAYFDHLLALPLSDLTLACECFDLDHYKEWCNNYHVDIDVPEFDYVSAEQAEHMFVEKYGREAGGMLWAYV